LQGGHGLPSLEDYSDAELKRMLKQAAKEQQYGDRESVSALDAFCSFLNMAGLAFIADAIKVAHWAWDRIIRIWHSIFGYDVDKLIVALQQARLRSQIAEIESALRDLEQQSQVARLKAFITLLLGAGLIYGINFVLSTLGNSGIVLFVDKLFGLNTGKNSLGQIGNGLDWVIVALTFGLFIYFYFIAAQSRKIGELRDKLQQKKAELESNEWAD
jgi:hypothetical protein